MHPIAVWSYLHRDKPDFLIAIFLVYVTACGGLGTLTVSTPSLVLALTEPGLLRTAASSPDGTSLKCVRSDGIRAYHSMPHSCFSDLFSPFTVLRLPVT